MPWSALRRLRAPAAPDSTARSDLRASLERWDATPEALLRDLRAPAAPAPGRVVGPPYRSVVWSRALVALAAAAMLGLAGRAILVPAELDAPVPYAGEAGTPSSSGAVRMRGDALAGGYSLGAVHRGDGCGPPAGAFVSGDIVQVCGATRTPTAGGCLRVVRPDGADAFRAPVEVEAVPAPLRAAGGVVALRLDQPGRYTVLLSPDCAWCEPDQPCAEVVFSVE